MPLPWPIVATGAALIGQEAGRDARLVTAPSNLPPYPRFPTRHLVGGGGALPCTPVGVAFNEENSSAEDRHGKGIGESRIRAAGIQTGPISSRHKTASVVAFDEVPRCGRALMARRFPLEVTIPPVERRLAESGVDNELITLFHSMNAASKLEFAKS